MWVSVGQYFIFSALCPSKSGLMNKHIVKHIVSGRMHNHVVKHIRTSAQTYRVPVCALNTASLASSCRRGTIIAGAARLGPDNRAHTQYAAPRGVWATTEKKGRKKLQVTLAQRFFVEVLISAGAGNITPIEHPNNGPTDQPIDHQREALVVKDTTNFGCSHCAAQHALSAATLFSIAILIKVETVLPAATAACTPSKKDSSEQHPIVCEVMMPPSWSTTNVMTAQALSHSSLQGSRSSLSSAVMATQTAVAWVARRRVHGGKDSEFIQCL